MTPLRRILGMAGPFRGAFSGAALFYVLYTVVSLVSLGMIIPVLDVILVPEGAQEAKYFPVGWGDMSAQDWVAHYVAQAVARYGSLGTLWRVSVAAFGLFILKNSFRYIALWHMATLRTGITAALRQALHQKVMRLTPATMQESRKGDILARASTDVTEIEWAILTGLELLVREPLVILGSLIVLVVMSAKLTLLLLVVGPLAAWLLNRVSKHLKRKSSTAQDRLGQVISALEESISGLRIVQAFQAEEYQQKRFDRVNQGAFAATREVHRRRDLASPLSELIGVFALLLILFYGGREVLLGHGLTGATLVAYLLFFYQLIPAFKSVSMALYNLQKGNAAADRLFEVLDLPENIQDAPVTQPWRPEPDGPKHIEFRQVTYTYPGASQPAVQNVSFRLERGQTVALVGPSGGGKTTLIHLLMRSIDPSEGGVFVDGIPLAPYQHLPGAEHEMATPPMSVFDLRAALALVTQDAFLFHGTPLENIAFGDAQPDVDRAFRAAKNAQATAFIEALPQGWDTVLGEGGTSLSGGQRQRMALARALYRQAPVLLLDEATSALDAENERLVQQALEAASSGRTTLVVAHRLATVQKADVIVVIHEGHIVEQGDHIELLGQGGLYASLVQNQMFVE